MSSITNKISAMSKEEKWTKEEQMEFSLDLLYDIKTTGHAVELLAQLRGDVASLEEILKAGGVKL